MNRGGGFLNGLALAVSIASLLFLVIYTTPDHEGERQAYEKRQEQRVTDAYNEGKRAGEHSLPPESCPYAVGYPAGYLRTPWMRGWAEGKISRESK